MDSQNLKYLKKFHKNIMKIKTKDLQVPARTYHRPLKFG